jgi:hypothetical protein
MPTDDSLAGVPVVKFLVIVSSQSKGKYFVRTFISTFPDEKFEFKTMREWSMIPLEDSVCKRIG